MTPLAFVFILFSAGLHATWHMLGEVRRRLRETADPIEEITFDCGWENPIPPKVLFKKRFGVSMREWRKTR